MASLGEVSNVLSTLAGEDGSAHKREQLACWLGLAAGGEVSDVARRQVLGTCSSPRAHHTGETLAGEDGSAHKREQLACWLGLAAGGEVSDVD